MIDKKKIQEAASIASIKDTKKGRNKEDYTISALADHENGFREGYIEGAHWAINEFLNGLWHDASEKPTRGKFLLTQSVLDIGTNKYKYEVETATLAHEIFHIACYIMEKAGISLCHESDEAYAYLIGYITKKVNECLSLSSDDVK